MFHSVRRPDLLIIVLASAGILMVTMVTMGISSTIKTQSSVNYP